MHDRSPAFIRDDTRLLKDLGVDAQQIYRGIICRRSPACTCNRLPTARHPTHYGCELLREGGNSTCANPAVGSGLERSAAQRNQQRPHEKDLHGRRLQSMDCLDPLCLPSSS
jgi:hypothetical protein